MPYDAAAGKGEEMVLVRKKPECNWIEMKKKHVFVSEDWSHPMIPEVEKKYLAEMMMTRVGYVIDKKWAMYKEDDAGEGGEEEMQLGHHSEKLVVAFGLMSTRISNGQWIRRMRRAKEKKKRCG